MPETQLGLKQLLSRFHQPHRGLDLEETSSLPLNYSDVTLMSSPLCPRFGLRIVSGPVAGSYGDACMSVNSAADENMCHDRAACV